MTYQVRHQKDYSLESQVYRSFYSATQGEYERPASFSGDYSSHQRETQLLPVGDKIGVWLKDKLK